MMIGLALAAVFWVSLTAVAYVYFGYPLALRLGIFWAANGARTNRGSSRAADGERDHCRAQ